MTRRRQQLAKPPAFPRDVVGPRDSLASPRYAGLGTFARLPLVEQVPNWKVGIQGIPFDSGTSYRPGARFGPSHIRQASRLLRPYDQDLEVAPFSEIQVADAGDCDCTPFDIARAILEIQARAEVLLANGRSIISMGGDHTIALPLLRAVAGVHGPLAVVHFDAHLDTWNTYFGAPYTHGTPFRRASEEGLIDHAHSIHVGVRSSIYAVEDLADDQSLGFTIIRASELEEDSVASAINSIRRRLGKRPIYVSVDIDVLDPSHAPGTGTPEAGGLTSRELLAILRGLDGLNVLGGDVVEVAPPYDLSEITGIAAAHIVYTILGLVVKARRQPRLAI